MTYTLDETWTLTSEHTMFGHSIRFHQSGSAVIMEVDGLCFVGDAATVFGESKIIFPRQLAMCPTLDDAQRAVRIAFEAAKRETEPAAGDGETPGAGE